MIAFAQTDSPRFCLLADCNVSSGWSIRPTWIKQHTSKQANHNTAAKRAKRAFYFECSKTAIKAVHGNDLRKHQSIASARKCTLLSGFLPGGAAGICRRLARQGVSTWVS